MADGSRQVLEWDVTPVVSSLGAGNYLAEITAQREVHAEPTEEEKKTLGDTIHTEDQYGQGKSTILIAQAALFETAGEGAERRVAIDQHAGKSGATHEDNIYSLKVDRIQPKARYTTVRHRIPRNCMPRSRRPGVARCFCRITIARFASAIFGFGN
jgi:hypothetical protein